MQDFRLISVTRKPDRFLVNNPTNYPLISQGTQGAVFKISDSLCVKIYTNKDDAALEQAAYQAFQNSAMTPRIYEKGDKYLVMEYLKGPSLDRLLHDQGMLPLSATKQILFVLNKMKQFHFTRIDVSLRHIFVEHQKQVKIIDLVHAYLFTTQFPAMLLGDLKKIGLLKPFLHQVKAIDPKTYQEWKEAPQFKSV